MVNLDEKKAWIERSRKGDHEAFEMLIRTYQKMIHSLTYRMTGSMVESEDLAQETFIQAFQQLETFRHEAKFSSWLYRIAVNLCLNWKKRDLRRQKAYEQWSGDKPSHTNSTENEQRNSQKVQEVM